MTPIQNWLQAFRLRTLPLAFSSILLGAFLAALEHQFNGLLLVLALLTTLFLQILSNLANDYGDFVKGTDNTQRIGPPRTLQAGLITQTSMRNAIVIVSILAFLSGISLLYMAGIFADLRLFLLFLGIGICCILAAITYTIGKNAYGYKGLGDISVLAFFGFSGVLGTHFLMTHHVVPSFLLPAFACGLLAVGVLNLNNLRDIENDKASGKNSIPVLIGFQAGKLYHASLIVVSLVSISTFDLLFLAGWPRFSFLVLVPLYLLHIYQVQKTVQNKELDNFLKQLALTSLFSTCVFGVGVFAQ